MSTRTIIEINHDYLWGLTDVDRDAMQLIAALRMLASGKEECKAALPSGVRILGQRHHSETLKLEVK